MNTTIKFSTQTAHDQKKYMATVIYNKIKANFDINVYDVFYDGIFEEGLKLTFFETLSKDQLESIHNILISAFNDYGCYYIDNEYFAGCIKELLYNAGCNVNSVYKQDQIAGISNLMNIS